MQQEILNALCKNEYELNAVIALDISYFILVAKCNLGIVA